MKPSECEIAIPDLKSDLDEQRAAKVLHDLPGIDEVRVVTGGIWAAYRAEVVSPESICEALRHAGLRASIFQDSATGRTGTFSS